MRKWVAAIAPALLLALVLLVVRAIAGTAQEDPGTLHAPQVHPVPMTLSGSVTQTLTFQQGISPTSAYTGAHDTYISLLAESTNYGFLPELRMSYDSRYRILLHFDLSAHLPRNATILSARLELAVYYRELPTAATDVGLYEVLRPWTESGATWRGSTADVSWETPGCDGEHDRAGDYIALSRLRNVGVWQTWENTPFRDLVQRWVAEPDSNLGVILLGLSNERQFWLLTSSQGIPAGRPRLVVSYLIPEPTPTATTTSTSTRTPTVTMTPSPTLPPTPTEVVTTAVVSGMAWRDDDGNMTHDPGEPPLAGVTIILKDPSYQEISRQSTGMDGSYAFTNLPGASYVLTREDPTGYSLSFPVAGSYVFYLIGGQQLSGMDFGFVPLPTATPTLTPTPTNSATATCTATPTATPSHTPTNTATASSTATSTATPTQTATSSVTPTSPPTATPSPTLTHTLTPTPRGTPAGNLWDPIPATCQGRYDGTTIGRVSAIQEYGACGAGLLGPEVIYEFKADYDLERLNISLDSPADLAVFVLAGASPSSCFYAGGSVVVPGIAANTTYLLAVDGSEAGNYILELNCQPPPATTPTSTRTQTLTPTEGPASSPTPTATPTPTQTRIPGGPVKAFLPLLYRPRLEYLVDCGSDVGYSDVLGRVWKADQAHEEGGWGYVGDTGLFSVTRVIGNTSDPALYQTQRWSEGAFGYHFSVPNGTYEVELHFAELYYRKAESRRFSVDIEGQTVLSDLDVFAAAGNQAFSAVTRSFTITVGDGELNVDLNKGSADNPMLNALRVARQ